MVILFHFFFLSGCQLSLLAGSIITVFQFSSVQLLSRVRLFATPWTSAHQDSLSITNSRSSLKLMSIESMLPSNHLIFCHSLLPPSIFPSIRSFQMSQLFASGSQSIGAGKNDTYQQLLFLGEVINNFNNLLFTNVFSKFSLFCFIYIFKET